MITEKEFYVISGWGKEKLWRFVNKTTKEMGHREAVNYLLDFRRDLQQALSKYARGKSQIDDLQLNIIGINMRIEKWCGEWFKPWQTQELIKSDPRLALKPQKVKGLVNSSWEILLRTRSY